jgi:hypothetical protein
MAEFGRIVLAVGFLFVGFYAITHRNVGFLYKGGYIRGFSAIAAGLLIAALGLLGLGQAILKAI